MIVLGLSPLDKDATVTLMQDGNVLFAAGEERFSRKKLQDGFPGKALDAGLQKTGIRAKDIDVVTYPFYTWEKEAQLFTKNLQQEQVFLKKTPRDLLFKVKLEAALAKIPVRQGGPPGLSDPSAKMEKPLAHRLWYRLAGSEGLLSRYIASQGSRRWSKEALAYHKQWHKILEDSLQRMELLHKLRRYDHHLAHAAAAFFASDFDRALIVTLDGYGSGLAGSVSIGEGTRIRRIHGIEYPHSLGTFYESVTSSLGFTPSRHEGKIVGLAAYGDPHILSEILNGRFHQSPGDFRVTESNNIYLSRLLASQFPKIDVAAAYQHVLENIAVKYVRHYVVQTGIDTLALAGGVMANVKLNQRLFEIPGVKRIFVYPNMGDGGCGTGAAFLADREHLSQRKGYSTVYFGPEYTDEEMVEALKGADVFYTWHEPIEPLVAKLIHDGHVVARFNGRMEYGPRALGNRSILYHASEPEVNQWLNQRLGRTEFMPFAPVTLYEERDRCYLNIRGAEHPAQFMTMTFQCTDFMKRTCPAAVHVDGTARPQLVREEVNPSYYRILREYAALSGIPSLINTSFNMHEEPIVNTPQDAVRAFLQGNLDYLAMGNMLVKHPASRNHHKLGR